MSDQDRALMENRAARSAWDWLAERYRTRRITPDTSPRLDLGVDSMEWLNLTMEIRETVGVELRDAAIGRIETVRDLLHEIVEASGQGGEPAAKKSLEHPEEALTWKQKQWLTPLGPVATMLFNTLYGLNRALVHALFRLEVHGLDRLPRDQQVVFTPNHVSYLDPFVLGAALPLERLQRSYWAGWTGAAFHNPVNTLISRLAKTIPIDPKKGIFSSLALGAAVLDGGDSLVWFPEGQRSPSGQLQDFRPGIAILLEDFDVAVVPLFILGPEKAMPVGTILPRPRKVHVFIGEPVRSHELVRPGEKRFREKIATALHDKVAQLSGKVPQER